MTHLKRRKFMKYATTSGLGIALSNTAILGSGLNYPENVRIGIIGIDTSHSGAFTKYINGQDNGFEVVAACTTVSKDIPASYERVDKFTADLKESGIQIVDSIGQLLELVDCILLETNDGRLHLEQAEQVFKTGKPVFIDKPVSASLKDAVLIYQAAKKHNVVTFSSSGTRFMTQAQKVRNGSIGKVLGADTFSPVKYIPSHSDLYWYGMHGVEHLFTVMRTGCTRVRRTKTDTCDTVVGEWDDGRIGTFRGIVDGSGGHGGHGGQAFGTDEIAYLGRWDGYEPLVDSVLHYFRTNEVPVEPDETLEIYAFMEAARVSTERNGDWVSLESVLKEAGN